MMGGTIEVHTQQGKGTEFVIRVTLRLQSERRIPQRIPELEGLKALVVDDDYNTCDSVTKMLSQVSVGCSAAKRSCSICGKDAGLCEHESGKYYGGKLCYAVLSDITDAYEWSFVAVPAQRAAGVVKRSGLAVKSAEVTENSLVLSLKP